ncbi:MAG: CerR family C-terminal domain-containing protein [Terriglobales bacterium]|jgi:AcrR family transcriptional regulator
MNSNRSQLGPKVVRRKRPTATPDPTREKLLEVAGPIFANRGYQATTIREICAGAEANVAAINYHFGDKLGLYTEVLQQSVRAAQVLAVHNALDQNISPEDMLRALIRARLRSINGKDLPDWHSRLLAHELAQPTPALRQLVDKVARPIFKRLLVLIGGMIGLPANDDKTRLCAISVVGQVFAYVLPGPLLSEIWPALKMTPEQVECIADHIADFSLSYLQDFSSKYRTITPVRKRRVSE